jgi:phage-related holin
MNTIRKFIEDIGLDPNNFTFYKAFIAFTVFFVPIFWTEVGIVALITVDFITAVIAAYKNKVPITSNRASKTVYKLLVYTMLLCTCLIADKLTELSLFVHFCTYFLVIVEVFSIGENFQKITGLSFVNYLKKYIESKVKGIDTEELAKDVIESKKTKKGKNPDKEKS